eukprot:SAG11_NODE_33413_length_277_cov_1.095506_1_plen_28_part_01
MYQPPPHPWDMPWAIGGGGWVLTASHLL